MLESITLGTIIYEIVYDREPFILEWPVGYLERSIHGIFIPYKPFGITFITESMINSTIFFSYMEAEERLNYIVGSVDNG